MLNKFLAKARLHPLRRRMQKPYYRFRSFEEVALAASWGDRIEANTATVDDWLSLPGISIHQARTLQQLATNGVSFNCIEDIAAALSLPVQQVRPWAAILQFCYYSDNALEPVALDANTASAEQLATIPAVDAFLARAIVHYRQAGPYRNFADLQGRLRLRAKVTAELLHYLRF